MIYDDDDDDDDDFSIVYKFSTTLICLFVPPMKERKKEKTFRWWLKPYLLTFKCCAQNTMNNEKKKMTNPFIPQTHTHTQTHFGPFSRQSVFLVFSSIAATRSINITLSDHFFSFFHYCILSHHYSWIASSFKI